MDHIAIMQKNWGLTEKIVTGQKVIESRWYNVKYAPWGRISPGDTVYFKNSGEPVTMRAEVETVDYYADLTPEVVRTILERYGKDIGIEEPGIPKFFEMFKHKKYCILIYLKHARHIPPFEINKHGFGMMASWICVDSVAKIRKTYRNLMYSFESTSEPPRKA
jgi:ASC-1-like (ASCH) protein